MSFSKTIQKEVANIPHIVMAFFVLTTVTSERTASRIRASMSLIFWIACSSLIPYKKRSTSEAGQNFSSNHTELAGPYLKAL